MTRTTVSRTINAPIDKVFSTIASIENFKQAIPSIVRVEFTSEARAGVGTRFRETRLMRGKEVTVELEVTELEPNDHVRIVSGTHGTVWDTTFTVKENAGQTDLHMVMDAKAYKLLPKIVNPLVKGMIQKAVEADLDSVKSFCESEARG
ncbi:MAG: SRPBCC family protein [Planctomycetota bacterium]|jgi:carbon monoxide dehydrogenase subunit G